VEAARRVQAYMIRDGRSGYPPEKVGEVVWHALTTPRPRVRYAVIPGSSLRRIIQMFLPKRMVDGIIAKNLGFK